MELASLLTAGKPLLGQLFSQFDISQMAGAVLNQKSIKLPKLKAEGAISKSTMSSYANASLFVLGFTIYSYIALSFIYYQTDYYGSTYYDTISAVDEEIDSYIMFVPFVIFTLGISAALLLNMVVVMGGELTINWVTKVHYLYWIFLFANVLLAV